jgi:hypothetical protein
MCYICPFVAFFYPRLLDLKKTDNATSVSDLSMTYACIRSFPLKYDYIATFVSFCVERSYVTARCLSMYCLFICCCMVLLLVVAVFPFAHGSLPPPCCCSCLRVSMAKCTSARRSACRATACTGTPLLMAINLQ